MSTTRDGEAGTRDMILQLIVERGPVTAAQLARILYLTPAAVRRHIGTLEEQDLITVREKASRAAKRGRPARHYVATNRGQSQLSATYSELAVNALSFIRSELGEEKVEEFAHTQIASLEKRYEAAVNAAGPDTTKRAAALVSLLSEDGYAASLRSVGPRGYALQLCQGHCPIMEVAGQFPEICEAETRAFSRLLGVHVQRLATLAGGDHVCTTHIPLLIPSSRTGHQSRRGATEGNS